MIESPRHELDEAIDRVAAKMVAADEDAAVLQRVMARLPDRSTAPWFFAWPVQLAAGAALVLVAFLWARPLERQVVPAVNPVARAAEAAAVAAIVEPAAQRADVRIPDRGPRIPRASLDRPDHERSLPPVDIVAVIELDAIVTPAIDLAAPAALEPLVLTELALDTKGDS